MSQKAYIKKLILKNFKKYADCEVEFSAGLNILVGPNNAGKTTILEAIDILLGERNLSPLAVKRSVFNSFHSGEHNSAKLVLQISYPGSCGTGNQEVNLIKQLKMGRGSSGSRLANVQFPRSITVDDIFNSTVPENGQFNTNLNKSGYTIEDIFLVTEISITENYTPEAYYDIYINFTDVDGNNGCYKVMGITGGQRASLFNYLFLPANRINNRALTEITDFNWLGRYIKAYLNKHDLRDKLTDYKDNAIYPEEIFDPQVQLILTKLFSKNEKLILDLFNKDDPDTIVANARLYISDGFNDEITNKAQGIQSAAIISLFSGYCKFQSSNVPNNRDVPSMWNTILSFEEPESHFQFPLRNKLLRILKEEFLDQGAQIFISTHDDGFMHWQYISQGHILFPGSLRDDRKITALKLPEITDEHIKRIIRFSGHSFFTDMVLIVEGQEEICVDLLFQLLTSKSLEESGVIITRVIGGVRSDGAETADTNPYGGVTDIPTNIIFFNNLGIETICLIDVDVLFEGGSRIKAIYKEKIGAELTLSEAYQKPEETGYLKLKHWWAANKDNPNFKTDIQTLSQVGIFFFPGDFESLFKEDYLQQYERSEDHSKLNKEKFTYDTKYHIEADQEDFIEHLSDEAQDFLNNTITKITEYVESVRENKKEAVVEAVNIVLDVPDEGTAETEVEVSDGLPF